MAIIKAYGKERIEYLEKTAKQGKGVRVTDAQKREMLKQILEMF